MKNSKAPQKMREMPTKAETFDEYIMESADASMPKKNSPYPIFFPVGFLLYCHNSRLSDAFSLSRF